MPHRYVAPVVAGCALALALAACGGSSPKPTASSNPELARSQCMRSHGVPNFPDPTQGPGGEGMSVSVSPGSATLTVEGIPFSGPAFQSALRTCRFFGGGGASPPPVPESQKREMVARARCIRGHGVPNFPDPIFPARGGSESGALGAGQNPRAPAVEKAAKACARVGTAIPGGG